MDFPKDTNTYNISNEYLFGHAFLIVPVTAPLYTNKTDVHAPTDFSQIKTWPVYLPKGTDWYNFWTGDKYQGGEKTNCSAPINQIPLFVRAGSIVPMGTFEQYTGEKRDTALNIRIYPGCEGNFTLYEDEDDNYDYEKGLYSMIHFHWNNKAKRLTIGKRKGEFPGILRKRVFHIIIVHKNHGNGIANSNITDKIIHYNGKIQHITF